MQYSCKCLTYLYYTSYSYIIWIYKHIICKIASDTQYKENWPYPNQINRGRLLLRTPGPVPLWDLHVFYCRQKGGDLTQSYDKSPYTNRNVETNLSWTCLVSGLLNFKHPSVLLFCFENIQLRYCNLCNIFFLISVRHIKETHRHWSYARLYIIIQFYISFSNCIQKQESRK